MSHNCNAPKSTAWFSCNIYFFLFSCPWHVLQDSLQNRYKLHNCQHMQKVDSSLFRSFELTKIHIEITLLDRHVGCQTPKMPMNSRCILFLSYFFHFCPHWLAFYGKELRHFAKFLLWCPMSLKRANDWIFTQTKVSICSI